MLTPQQKSKVIEKSRIHANDTGSPEAQIALLTAKIERLTKHFGTHAKDRDSRVGLLKMVAKRKRLTDYLKRHDAKRYAKVAKARGSKK